MRRWKIKLQFENGLTHLTSFTLVDVAAFIKETKVKNNGINVHRTLPIDTWLIDMVFGIAQTTGFGTKLSYATIIPEVKK